MKNIETELDVLIGKEGGYSNDPKDSGGETIWGITIFTARSFGYTGNMRDMTKDVAKEIYRSRYWIQPKYSEVFKLNPEIAFELFDTGVNAGTSTASKFLQRALNVLNLEGTLYPDMAVDGVIGAMTLEALRTFLVKRGKDGNGVLLKMLNSLQSVKYIEIAEANKTQERFQFGWQLNRVEI